MVNIYRVFPGGVGFETSNLTITRGDAHYAFRKAHRFAAEQAARLKVPHYVTRDDTGQERYGFGDWDAEVLQYIMRLGLESFWCFEDREWKPLPAEKTEDEELVEVVIRQ